MPELSLCPDKKQKGANPNQQLAITHTAGAAQILAGPGSGKTFVTVQRIKHLITHHGVDPANILVITFTKAAARSMQERFFELVKPHRPPVWFGTFHAVFYHILRQSEQYRGYTIITDTEKRKLIKKIVQIHKRFVYVKEEDYEKMLTAVSRAKNKEAFYDNACSIQPPLSEMSAEDFSFFLSEYQGYLTEFGQMDFDDICLLCRKLLKEQPKQLERWQKQFRYILIDEFQDIAPVQYQIMRMLAEPENNLFVVGDDDQSIYRFRGATPASMRQFMKDYPHAKQILLDINYRCHRQIVEASLAMIEENKDRFSKKIKANHEEGDGIECRIFSSKEEEQQYLLQNLKKQMDQGVLDQSAIILRTNYECGMIAQILEQAKIPYCLKEIPKSRFSHFVIQDILAYLKLVQGSRERGLFLRIMNRPVRYIRRESLREETVLRDEWLKYYENVPSVRKEIDCLYNALEYLYGKKPYLAVRYIRSVLGYDGYLKEKYEKEQAEEFIQLAEDFQEFTRQFSSFAEIDDYISQYEEMIKRQKQTVQNNIAQKTNGVTLMTMHASKGLEFECVYLTGCEEGRIPSKKAVTEEELAEERRLFYVAMTRAKRKLYITAVQEKTGKATPSRFLQAFYRSSESTNSSNSAASRYSSKASSTASYSSSSSIY